MGQDGLKIGTSKTLSPLSGMRAAADLNGTLCPVITQTPGTHQGSASVVKILLEINGLHTLEGP
jgi:hypothetical protein